MGRHSPVFDDLGSLIHVVAGFAAGLLPITPLWFLTPVIVLVFSVYEAVEYDDPLHTLGDFTELLIGFSLGVSVALHLR